MKKTQEQIFLQVKERLDYYRLPTIFPYQAVDLLSELLNLLDRNVRKNGKENLQLNNVHSQNQLNQAARLQIGKVVKENNKLHLDLISAKEEIITLKHNNDKYLIERSGGNKETVLLIQAQRRRQDELFDQLTRVKFKYNQLMDLVHQDSEIQKKYLKRLMKHQRMEITQKNYSPENSQSKKGPHQTTTDLQAKIILLQNKIANREAQIMRLQKRSQYDGLNMNKILKDFQNSRTDNKVSALQQQINYLEEENKKMKKQVNDCRKKGGSKQALRQQMRKNHQTIQNIAKQNKQLKRKLKIKDFDVEARSKQGQRQIQKSKIHALNKQEQSEITRLENGDLKKKIQFLEGQLKAANLNIQKQGRKIQESQILFEKIKNSQEGDKILAQYQIQSLKQKAEQLQSQLQNKLQRIRQLEGENIYHKKQDKLKNQAIENLQKIVDQLMRRNNQKQINLNQAQYQSNTLQNTIALRKNLGQMKQQLAITQNDKAKLERELQTLLIRFDKISQQNANLNNDYNKLRVRFAEIKNNQQQFSILQRQITTLQSDLKKEQNFRYKIDQLHQEAENDKTRLRKQLQGVTQQYQIYERKTKNHLNTLKTQVNELQQSNQMFELIGKEKDKKILVMQAQIDQLLGRIKLLKQQTSLLEDQKLAAIRQKHKYEKRCQQMLRVSNQAASTTSKTHQYKLNELHTQLIEYQNQIKRLHEKIAIQNEQINQLNSYCDAVKSSQQNIARQKNQIKHEYDILRNRLSRQSANGGNQQEEE